MKSPKRDRQDSAEELVATEGTATEQATPGQDDPQHQAADDEVAASAAGAASVSGPVRTPGDGRAPGRGNAGVTDEDIAARVAAAVAAADDRQALDLKVLDLAGVSDFTDYFLICSGANDRQVQAIADAVDAALRERKIRPLHQEGKSSGRWVLLDYGDFIVHVFRDETRRFYALERLWADAPEVTDRFRE